MKGRKPHSSKDTPSDSHPSAFGFYTRIPPAGVVEDIATLPSPYVTELELPAQDVMIPLFCKKGEFERTKNPLPAFEAIAVAFDAGLYPPIWALGFLVEGIKNWHAQRGLKSLDAVLGLTGHGRDHAFKAAFMEIRDEKLCLNVFLLHKLFSLSPGKASELVVEHLDQNPGWDTTGWNLRPLEPRTIANKYGKHWKRILDTPEHRKAVDKWTKEQRLMFLRQFPKGALPRHLQALL